MHGLFYDPAFVSPADRAEIVGWLAGIRPLWEDRFTEREALAAGGQRRLLRPVYWLGNWQFACLNYYRPPRGIHDRCVQAEPYPPALARLVARIEKKARAMFRGADMPEAWHLNTCLVNLYGARVDADGKRTDTARVGEHRDDEPGPVASISLGERALFQFVATGGRHEPKRVVHGQWLDDRSLLIFGGHTWKRATVHRVLRVDRRQGARFDVDVEGFETRRVNFTFRYVPDEHILPYARLGHQARSDVERYVRELARSSQFFAEQLQTAVS
ncbi:MAG TPA: alpha-ketoglutarate-dependent dioxygenase AlkB [Candidatus Limnocylindrales bacterium]|nr:alpha-ketoglutarate-dependent dioxygenase AlkB [Candidatus Limnocylindrales bacterium]